MVGLFRPYEPEPLAFLRQHGALRNHLEPFCCAVGALWACCIADMNERPVWGRAQGPPNGRLWVSLSHEMCVDTVIVDFPLITFAGFEAKALVPQARLEESVCFEMRRSGAAHYAASLMRVV